MRKLVEQAEGESVTVDKLDGSKKYFPDASAIFQSDMGVEGEVPHHIVLLTNSGALTRLVQGEVLEGGGMLSRTSTSLVLTNRALYLISAAGEFFTFPYDNIQALYASDWDSSGTVAIQVDGTIYEFELARSGDPEAVTSALGYLRQQIS
ncbi:hypothetical protein [Haloarcula amylolytica]|uniref:hypothetical protein n=1 Tax=Haloarcula amylolytica TaxID=396317 RepID=UPI0012671C09|nr:hypothetical protein [Haloarcula amylolytica]